MLNCKYKPKLQKFKLLSNNKLQTTQPNPDVKLTKIKKYLCDRLSVS